MKRIRKSLILICLFVIGITFNVKAANFEYYITNSNNYEPINNSDVKNIKRGDTIIVTAMLFNGDSVTDYKISSGNLTVRWDDKFLSLEEVNGKYYNESISDIPGLTLGGVNKINNKITFNEISSTGLKDKLNKIAEFKFKVLETAESRETKIYQMDGENSLTCTTSEENTVSCGESMLSELKYTIAKSTVNKLSSIKINGMDLEYFNENTNDYELEVDDDVKKVNIEVTKKDNRSTVTGNFGENELVYGENKLKINVVSESGATNTYNIVINRVDARSSVNTLKTLTLSAGEMKFKPDVTEYTITVNNEIDKITITSTLTDPKSRYVEDYSNKEIELIEGSNKVEIHIISEKGDENVYTLNINRALSSNNSLKSLKINDEKIKLNENEFIYNFIVENDVDEVVIKAEPNDSKATVKIDDVYPLEIGENEINIVVTAADGKEAAYIINITRNKLLSKDSLLSSLKIRDHEIDFKQNVTTYDIKIDKDVDKLDITATPEDPNARVEIEGNKDLEDGSIIKINVKAEDGTYGRYFLRIEKKTGGISPIVIILIVLLLMLAACIGIIFYRKKSKEKKEFDKLDEQNNKEKLEEQQETVSNEVKEVQNDLEDNNIEVGAHEYVGEHESNVEPEEKKVLETEDEKKDVE